MSCSPTCSRGLATQHQCQKLQLLQQICRADLAALTHPSRKPHPLIPHIVVLQQVAERLVENKMWLHLLVLVGQGWGQGDTRTRPALALSQAKEFRLRPQNSTAAAAAAAQPSDRQHVHVLQFVAQLLRRKRTVRRVMARML